MAKKKKSTTGESSNQSQTTPAQEQKS